MNDQKTYRMGVIGFAHMHVNTLIDSFSKLEKIKWIGCADTKPLVPSISMEPGTRRANVKRTLEEVGIPKYYEDYHEMLEQEAFDIIIVGSENAFHGEVVEAVASRGIHVIVEKPMAASLSDALRMVRAVKKANVSLAVNWPSTWNPIIRTGQKIVQSGEIGEIVKFHYRNGASLGPMSYGQKMTEAELGAEWWYQSAAGGGAFLDYCCYGACLARWYIGEPAVGAYGMKANLRSTYGDAEDNGLLTVRFPKAVAALEGSWTTVHTGLPNGPVVFGTEGTLVCDNFQNKVLVFKDRWSPKATAVYDAEPLPKGRANIAEEFIHHLETGEPLHPTLDLPVNLDAMAILDAGIRSAAEGKLAFVNDIHWNIG